MNNLKVFNNEMFGQVRVIEENGEPWFVAKDIAEILGYTTLERMYDHIDNEDKIKINPQSEQYQGLCENSSTFILTIINESGLYESIFGSTLPMAKKFKKWVTSEVLPALRKHGMYAKDELLDNPDLLLDVVTRLKEERQLRLEAEATLVKAAPKVDAYDRLIATDDFYTIEETAKLLSNGLLKPVSRNRLFEILRDKHVLTKNNLPVQSMINSGYMSIKTTSFVDRFGDERVFQKTLVTPKGLEYTRRALIKIGEIA